MWRRISLFGMSIASSSCKVIRRGFPVFGVGAALSGLHLLHLLTIPFLHGDSVSCCISDDSMLVFYLLIGGRAYKARIDYPGTKKNSHTKIQKN